VCRLSFTSLSWLIKMDELVLCWDKIIKKQKFHGVEYFDQEGKRCRSRILMSFHIGFKGKKYLTNLLHNYTRQSFTFFNNKLIFSH